MRWDETIIWSVLILKLENMITINFERVKLVEICISTIALNAAPKEVLAKVNAS